MGLVGRDVVEDEFDVDAASVGVNGIAHEHFFQVL
jgi:hypothetical protein